MARCASNSFCRTGIIIRIGRRIGRATLSSPVPTAASPRSETVEAAEAVGAAAAAVAVGCWENVPSIRSTPWPWPW